LLDARAVADLDLDAVVGFEVRDRRARKLAGVELREDPVGAPEGLLALDGNRALVVETQADEGEHSGFYSPDCL
jgi:hypothetical protein